MIIDIAIIIIFILFIWRGAARGFSDAMLKFAFMVIGILAAVIFGAQVAAMVGETALKDRLQTNIASAIENGILPDVLGTLGQSGSELSSLSDSATTWIANNFSENLAELAINVLTPAAIMLGIWLLATIIRWIFRHKKDKDSLLSKTNRLLGGLLGAVKAFVLVTVLLMCLFPIGAAISPFSVNTFVEQLDESVIGAYIFENNPLWYALDTFGGSTIITSLIG